MAPRAPSVVVVSEGVIDAPPLLESKSSFGADDSRGGTTHVEVCVRIRPLEITSQSNDFFQGSKKANNNNASTNINARPAFNNNVHRPASRASPQRPRQPPAPNTPTRSGVPPPTKTTTPRKPPVPSARTPNKAEVAAAANVAAKMAEELDNPSTVAWDVVSDDTVCQSRETTLVQGRTHSYTLDKIYSPLTTTLQIYQQSVRPLVQSALDGYHTAVLAYGQTSTGKTFTMSGTQKAPGLIPLAMRDCFDFLQSSPEEPPREYLLRVSYLEVYKEHIRDLLVPQHQQRPIQLFENPKDGLIIRGLREEVVTCPDQVLTLLQQGEARRHVGSTMMNEHSSRSHVILRLWIESRPSTPNTSATSSLSDEASHPASGPKRTNGQGGGNGVRVSSLSLVDLAGSESVRLNGSDRRQEGQYINKSLMTLGQIVLSLSEAASSSGPNKKGLPQHIPYRDSKLTRLLQPCLSGNAQLALICCISPLVSHLEESHNTLKFATRAKRIPQRATIQEGGDEKTLLQTYRDEIEELKTQLAEAKEQQRQLMEDQKQQSEQQVLQIEQDQQKEQDAANINGGNSKPTVEKGIEDQEILELVEAIQTMERLILKGKSPKPTMRKKNLLDDILEEGNDSSSTLLIDPIGDNRRDSDDGTGSFKFLGDVVQEEETPRSGKVNLNMELQRVRKLLGSVLEKKRHHRRPSTGSSPRRVSSMADDDGDYADDDHDELEVLRAQLQQHEVTTSLRKADSSFLQSQLEEKDQLLQEISSVLEAVETRQLQLEAENAALREEVINLREINRDLQDKNRPTGMTQAFHPLY